MPNLNSIVSINIVILNGEKYIHHCLNSVLTQSYSPKLIEINILDNGSTDGTVGFIENWKMKLRRLNMLNVMKRIKLPLINSLENIFLIILF